MTETWNPLNPIVTNQVANDVPDIEENFDYLMACHGYLVDSSEADQGAAGSGNSLKDLVDAIGSTKKATLFFKHHAVDGNTTTYTLTTSDTVTSNITLMFQEGAVIDGAGTLTINGPLRAHNGTIFGTSITVAGSPIVDRTIPEWWGAAGDGSTEDYTAVNSALTHWLQRTVKGEFRFLSGKNYLISTAISKTMSSDYRGGWSINGYGSKITSGLSTGYLFTFTCATAGTDLVGLYIHGLFVTGSGSEDGILKLDGGVSGMWFYNLSLRDLNFYDFEGTGIYITQQVFETSLSACTMRANSSNTTGYGYHFKNDGGTVSSIDMVNCNAFGGLYGLYVESTVGDVDIIGGTFNDSQQYGAYLANHFGASVVNCHFENNWESAANIAAGNAGLYIVGHGTVIGAYGTTASKQKYVVRLYANAGKVSNIIGGRGGGSTTTYAYLHGDTNSSINLLTNETYEAASGTTCSINRVGLRHRDNSTVSSSGTGEDDLQTYVVAADSMGTMGGLRIIAAGTKTGANGNKTIKLHVGSSSYTFNAAANDTTDWRVEAVVHNENSAAVQRVSWLGFNGVTPTQGYEDETEDTTAAMTVKITGECANASDTISQKMWIVERI